VVVVAQSVAAQTQPNKAESDEVQQLKERLRQLEESVKDLKAQLSQLSTTAQPHIIPADTASATSSAASRPADMPSVSPNVDRPGDNPPPAKPAKQDKQSENTLQIYGMAMLDMGYDFKQNDPDWFDVVRPSRLPSFKDQFAPDGKVYFGVRQSRLGVQSTTPTPFGDLKTIFEFELFGTGVDAGQTTFRLRHAYGELGHFGAGQYWTAFGDTDAYPNTIEYWGPNGVVSFRNVQFRWMPITGSTAVTLALERPGASGDQGVLADRIELQGIRPKFDLPDLTGNIRFNRDWGHLQFSGVVRRIRWVDTTNDQFDLSGSAVGWGASVSSSVNLGKKDVARIQTTYGEGIENYMNDAPVDIGIARTNSSNPARPIKGVALPVIGMSSFLDHTWSKRFTSSIGYSMVNIDNSEGQAADAYHQGHYGLANLMFYPYDNVMVGGEFQWGRRENFRDGFAANDYRIQFAFRYKFSKVVSF
jgi:hypothetical protein